MRIFLVIIGLSLMLCGCLSGGGGGGSGSSGINQGDSYSSSFSSVNSGDSNSGENHIVIAHNPEPLTIFLWGSGLLGIAFLKKKKG